MKRCVALVISLILILSLAACGKEGQAPVREPEKEPSQGGGKVISDEASPSPASEPASEPSSQPQTEEPSAGPSKDLSSKDLPSIAADFAVNFYEAFESPEELDPTRFCLWKIYYEDPTAVGQDGILWVKPERLREEVLLRFDLTDYQFQSPEQENVYPRYVEEKGAIAFYPAGDGSRYAAVLAGTEEDRDYKYYIFDIYDDFITDGHEEMTLERTLVYQFRVVETAGGSPVLQAVSAREMPRESAPAQSGGQSVIEGLTQEEQQSYYKEYLAPYEIVGLLYSTWSDPEEIEVWRYMHFFTYNEDKRYYMAQGHTVYQDHSVPADVVEDYVTSYFEVAPAYLRTSEKYDASAGSYRSMANEGIGGGPAPVIERIEVDGDRWKFVCRDISDNLLSVTIRMMGDGTFRYIAGEGLDL